MWGEMMGYFSNGEEGMLYEEEYCLHCQHWVFDPETQTDGCPVMDMHTWHNREEANNKDSALHKWMIPRSSDGVFNEKCLHFRKKAEATDG